MKLDLLLDELMVVLIYYDVEFLVLLKSEEV